MIDIETLDITPNSTILTIGLQGFDPFSDRFTEVTYYERLDLESQDGRSIDDGTVEWWGKQSAAAQEEALGDIGRPRITLKDALTKLGKIIWKHNRIWANGTTFDMVILENAFKQQGVPMPWKYWQVMDARTIYKMAPTVGKLGNNHNALADCVNQIDMLQKALKILNINKF
jgi:hypothetical protein